MEVRKEDFPVVIQSYDLADGREIFLAEQVVNSQHEIDLFTSRYAGKLIKASQFSHTGKNAATSSYKKKSGGGTLILIVIIILIILVAIGFATGWVQRTF